MQEQYDLIQEIDRSGTMTLAESRRLKENTSRYESVMSEFSSWVDREGNRYGIRIQKDR
jgi:hypothetical protein